MKSKIKFIERSKCVISGAKDLEYLNIIKDFPIWMGCTNQSQELDQTFDMEWSISKSSGLIQLKKLIPLDLLYPEQHGPGTIGKIWKKHHKSFAEFITKKGKNNVLEIGGGHGILSIEANKLNLNKWTIIEPNPKPVEGCKANFIKGFFDNNFKNDQGFDTFVHSHLLEHLYDPLEFLQVLKNISKPGDKHIFSIPNLKAWLERKFANALMFEHTLFLSEPYIDYILSKNGFYIEKKEYFEDYHSIFYSTIRDDKETFNLDLKNLYVENLNLYKEYVSYMDNLITSLNKKIKKIRGPLYLFGAHVFSQTLIAYGLKTDKIVCILDNDKNKQNKRLYGTQFKVYSPEVIKEEENPTIILKAGPYSNEITTQIANEINENAEFL